MLQWWCVHADDDDDDENDHDDTVTIYIQYFNHEDDDVRAEHKERHRVVGQKTERDKRGVTQCMSWTSSVRNW